MAKDALHLLHLLQRILLDLTKLKLKCILVKYSWMGIKNVLLVFDQTIKNRLTHFAIFGYINSFQGCTFLPAIQLLPVKGHFLFALEALVTNATEKVTHWSECLFSLMSVLVLANHVTLKVY